MTGWLYGIFHVHSHNHRFRLRRENIRIVMDLVEVCFFLATSSPCRSVRACSCPCARACVSFLCKWICDKWISLLLGVCENLYAIYPIQPRERVCESEKKYEKYSKYHIRCDYVCLVNIVWYFRFTKHFTVFYLRLLVKRCVILYVQIETALYVRYIERKATVVLIKHERAEIQSRVSAIFHESLARTHTQAAFNKISSN